MADAMRGHERSQQALTLFSLVREPDYVSDSSFEEAIYTDIFYWNLHKDNEFAISAFNSSSSHPREWFVSKIDDVLSESFEELLAMFQDPEFRRKYNLEPTDEERSRR